MRNTIFWMLLSVWVIAGCGRDHPEETSSPLPENFDWQGHRGARGLLPENSIPAFLKALEFPLRTLEMDVVISADSQVVVSHEPWMSHEICKHPNGRPVLPAEENALNILEMNYARIQEYDCGSRGNRAFPGQEAQKVKKPLLSEVVKAVQRYCSEHNREPPQYNIEIKSRPQWDDYLTPPPETFARLLLQTLDALAIADRSCVQSFDPRALRAVRARAPHQTTALLVESPKSVDAQIEELGFTPAIYSPYYKLVSARMVEEAHQRQMQIIPWTVNDSSMMARLIELGVDGIITDYPDRIWGD